MKKSILKFVCTLLVIALLGFTLLHGVDLGFAQIPSITNTEDGIRLGLDLVGGSIITYQADIEGEMAPGGTEPEHGCRSGHAPPAPGFPGPV